MGPIIHNTKEPSLPCLLYEFEETSAEVKPQVDMNKEDALFPCSLCHFKTTIKSRLIPHMIAHSRNRHYTCSQCSFVTKFKGRMMSHLRLKRHMKSSIRQSDKRIVQYPCSVCDFMTHGSRKIDRHMRLMHGVHEDRLYSCPLCHYKAKRVTHLTRHMQTRTRKYPCPICNFTTPVQSEVKSHLRQMHGILTRHMLLKTLKSLET